MERPLDEAGWKKAFGELPEATQDRLRHWFATQALIISDLGIAEDEWFGLVGWAMEHPWDRSHLEALPASEASKDATEGGGIAKQRAAALDTVGASVSATVATGDGLAQRAQKAQAAGAGLEKELYQRFMNQRMNETTRRPKGPPPAKPIKR
ncbi:MAG: hypothetical protein IPG45_06860 [Deltaproteobacteria bacterium]|nr:hypothetical protein [Deltaproteobacteria bacterium]